VTGSDAEATYQPSSGTLNVNCPAQAAAHTYSLTFGVAPIPDLDSRAYLYLRRNPFYSDSVNAGAGIDGMFTSSDTSSAQQITAILTELAQTAESVANPTEYHTVAEVQHDNRTICNNAIVDYVKSAPYYNYEEFQRVPNGGLDWPISLGPSFLSATLHFIVKPLVRSNGQVTIKPLVSSNGQRGGDGWNHGLVAFFPIAAIAEIRCSAPGETDEGVLISAPTVVTLYTESQFLDPQRDFLRNPEDTFTFSDGIITGHKYTAQSPAKTIVDTITAPIRALMPSVTVTQSTQVQTNASGAVTSTTSSNSTQTAPSKGP
jgi:hypothetical protein